MAHSKDSIVMFPLMAQGHLIPFLALAQKIEQTTNCTIFFVNTPVNISKLSSSIPSDSDIHLLEIPFNGVTDYGLLPNAENTDSLPYNLILLLLEATLSLKPSFNQLLSNLIRDRNGRKPLCVISDTFFPWCAEVAHELGVFHVMFSGSSTFGFACYYSICLNLPHRSSECDEYFTLPDFPEASRFHVTQLAEHIRVADGEDQFSKFIQSVFSMFAEADGILFNTVEELDLIGLNYFRRKFKYPVWSIGPVLLTGDRSGRAGIKKAGTTPELCKKWLDNKPDSSVLYVSFGSQNTISATQMLQLATALELTGKSFIWVVRPPVGFDINSEFNAKEWLPEGFEERVSESKTGLLIKEWAPQVEILSHKSVCGFLSHCGWNSVLEALSHGVPILGWPMAAEQFYNVKILEDEIGVCVELARGRTSEVKHEAMSAKIEMVMNQRTGKGKEMRRRAGEVKEMIRKAIEEDEGFKGSSVKAMDEFLNAALTMRQRMEKEA